MSLFKENPQLPEEIDSFLYLVTEFLCDDRLATKFNFSWTVANKIIQKEGSNVMSYYVCSVSQLNVVRCTTRKC